MAMSRIKSVGLAFASALALVAFIGTASASAFTVWQRDGSNVATSVAVSQSASLELTHRGGLGGNFTVACTGTGLGTVAAGGAGTVDSITVTSCTTIAGTCASPRAAPANLGWVTQLSGTRDNITMGSSRMNPGWTVTCSGFAGRCTAATSAAITNSTPNVLATFDSSSATASCTDFGTGTVTGTVTNSIAGHTLSAA